MEDRTKRKLEAAGKIAFGVGTAVSAVVMATGHGFVGALMKKNHMMGQAARMASKELKAAGKHFDEGVEAWKKA